VGEVFGSTEDRGSELEQHSRARLQASSRLFPSKYINKRTDRQTAIRTEVSASCKEDSLVRGERERQERGQVKRESCRVVITDDEFLQSSNQAFSHTQTS
jgi:hypothetical protein